MKNLRVILIMFLPFCLCTESCVNKDQRNVGFFKNTPAYGLAKAVEKGDLKQIENMVKDDSTLLEIANPVSGSNVLVLCLYVEQFESFKKLLELGADPNFLNPYTKYSVLILSIDYFGSSLEWIEDSRYAKLLLDYGADPKYAIEDDFTNEKNHHVMATSPLIKASRINLDLVKLLIEYGADPYRRLGEKQRTPFRAALQASQFEIIYYFINSLNVNVNQPLYFRTEDSLFIQDYVVTRLMFNNIRAEQQGLPIDIEGAEERWNLIKYLESKGVDFVNYKYKRLK